MDEIKENNESFDNIKVFSSDDEKLKLLGELLSNESSRRIIRLLMDKEMYTNEIAVKCDMGVSLIIHHLKKMESLGLLNITEKQIVRKGDKHRFYKINSDIFITANQTKEEIEEKGILEKVFKDGVKFVAAGLVSWFAFSLLDKKNERMSEDVNLDGTPLEIIVIPILIISVILGIMFLIKNKKIK